MVPITSLSSVTTSDWCKSKSSVMIAMLGMIKILTLVSGVSVVLARTSIRSVLSLMMVFVGLASYWIVLGMDVLGVLLVLVYVGAVIVLFLFVVMMIGETGSA